MRPLREQRSAKLGGNMKSVLIGLAAAAISTGAAGAATLVDTGPGTANAGLILEGDPGLLDWTQAWHAGQFELTSASNITSLEVWLSTYGPNDGGGDLTMRIYGADGVLPGATPALYEVTGHIASTTASWQGFHNLDFDLGPGLYWLSLEPAAASSFQGSLWMQPSNPLNHYAMNIRGVWEWDPQGRDGPDQWGIRIEGAATAVPEPASWALMIVGFGAVGAAVRGRRRSTALA